MFLHIENAEYLTDYKIRLWFNDGKVGVVDLEDKLHGPVFAPLKDRDVFKDFHCDPLLHTVVWPNGADLAPEYLRDNLC